MTKADWTREVTSGELSVHVGPDGVVLEGPNGSEPLTSVEIERLHQALVDYREHSGLNWEWSRKGSGWWK